MGAGHPVMTRDGKYILGIHHKDDVIAVIDTGKQEVTKIFTVGPEKNRPTAAMLRRTGNTSI